MNTNENIEMRKFKKKDIVYLKSKIIYNLST